MIISVFIVVLFVNLRQGMTTNKVGRDISMLIYWHSLFGVLLNRALLRGILPAVQSLPLPSPFLSAQPHPMISGCKFYQLPGCEESRSSCVPR